MLSLVCTEFGNYKYKYIFILTGINCLTAAELCKLLTSHFSNFTEGYIGRELSLLRNKNTREKSYPKPLDIHLVNKWELYLICMSISTYPPSYHFSQLFSSKRVVSSMLPEAENDPGS